MTDHTKLLHDLVEKWKRWSNAAYGLCAGELEAAISQVEGAFAIIVQDRDSWRRTAEKIETDIQRTEAGIAALKETMACGHPKACWVDDAYQPSITEHHMHCTACELARLERAAALNVAIEIIELSPTFKAHSDRPTLCWCVTCTYVRRQVTEIRARLLSAADQSALDALIEKRVAEARLNEHKRCCHCSYPTEAEYEAFGCVRRTDLERAIPKPQPETIAIQCELCASGDTLTNGRHYIFDYAVSATHSYLCKNPAKAGE